MKPATCSVCLESNLVLFGGAPPRQCPGHRPFNETHAVTLFRDAVERLVANGRPISQQLFDVGRFLTPFDTAHPCPRATLERQFCIMDVPSRNERRVKRWVEDLRREWLLPIGSHKSGGGYYFITDPEDFLRWQKENISGAITAITTNYRVFRHNFKEIAGQQSFDFRANLQEDIRAALEAV
jgi:hypothetical protein